MLSTLIVTLCLATGQCKEVAVADMPLDKCFGVTTLQSLPHWLDENGYLARGYKIRKWGCRIGKKAEDA